MDAIATMERDLTWSRLRGCFSRASENPNFLGLLFVAPAELIARVAAAHNMPLYCGEWGCIALPARTGRAPGSLRWYADMRRVLEERGIAWATWDGKGSFGLVEEDGTVDEELVRVLLDG